MKRFWPSGNKILNLAVVAIAVLPAACSQYRHGCLGGPCRSYIKVRIELVGATLPDVSKAVVMVRGLVIERDQPPPPLDRFSLPHANRKWPHSLMQIVELDYQSTKRVYVGRFRWDLLSDEKTWLYAFVDLNSNDHLDPGEPYGVLRGAPKVVTVCKTTVVSITVDFTHRWKGKKRW